MKKGIKKTFQTIFPILIVILFSLFFFLLKNAKSTELQLDKTTAKSIISQYKKISYGKTISLKNTTIVKGGSYFLSGDYQCITINTRDSVQLILDNANISCPDGPAIYVEDSKLMNIETQGENVIDSTSTLDLKSSIYSKDNILFSGDGTLFIHSNYDGIVSKNSIMFESGNYIITSEGDGIKGSDAIYITSGYFNLQTKGDGFKTANNKNVLKGNMIIDYGTFKIQSKGDGFDIVSKLIMHNGYYDIQCTGDANKNSTKGIKSKSFIQTDGGEYLIVSNDDGIHCDNNILINDGNHDIHSFDDGIHTDGILQVNGGNITVDAKEGLESTTMNIQGGSIHITAQENGMTVGKKHPKDTVAFNMKDGNIDIRMINDNYCAIDSNQTITISGGELRLNAGTPFCYSGEAKYNGGTIIVNGEKLQKIPEVDSKERQPLVNNPEEMFQTNQNK